MSSINPLDSAIFFDPNDPNNDPSFLDPTNPASPYYDPTLADAAATTVDPSIAANSDPSAINTANANTNKTDTNDVLSVEKQHRHHRRHLRQLENIQQAIINSQQQTNPTEQSDGKFSTGK